GGEKRAARATDSSGYDARSALRDPTQHAVTEGELTWSEGPFASEVGQQGARHADLLCGITPGPDDDAGRVADKRDQLLVDVRVPPDLGVIDVMGPLELLEARLQGLRNDLMVDTRAKRARGAAPDRHD